MTRLCALALCAALPACVAPVPASPAAGGGDARTVLAEVNAHRQGGGCAPLAWSDAASRAAAVHSADMARRGYFSHTSPEGAQPWDRLRAEGLAFSRAAENIARTTAGGRDAVRLWLGSSGHRANIETCAYTHTGIGSAGGYWTQLFFTPAALAR
jgi:uncharacterized protein YkwD